MSAVLTAVRSSEPGDYAEQVGERIVTARRELNLTQVELAELVGVSQRSMQAYENGEVIPYRKMKELAAVLQKPVAWLLHGEDAMAEDGVRLVDLQRQLDDLTKLVRSLNRKLS